MPPSWIPRTSIELLHREVSKQTGGAQTRLDWLERTGADSLADVFARSAEEARTYDNRDEPFRSPTTTALDAALKDDATNTISVALRIRDRGPLSDGDGPYSYRYVEREIVPQRTTDGARFNDPLQETAGDVAGTAMKVDLLLEADDGTPAVGEIKIKDDKDPIAALVQVLAAAALLASDHQRERLHRHHDLRTDGRLDVVLLFVDYPTRDLMRKAMDEADALATALMRDDRVTAVVRRIVAFTSSAAAIAGNERVEASVAFAHESAG